MAGKGWSHQSLRLWITVSLVLIVQSSAVEGWIRLEHNAIKLRTIVAALKKQLDISAEVSIVVVPQNNLLVSVEPVPGRKGFFQMSLDATFLAMLDDNDLFAVVAHELGHVWIFTHHPYLHTEDLANNIANRVVTMAALDHVYEKVRLLKSPPANLEASVRQERTFD